MRTPIKENSPRDERLRTFFLNCCCNSSCCYYYKLGIINHMNANFKYILDPLFIFSSTLYTVNKLSLFPPYWWGHKFINAYLNDVLLIPVMLPIILFFSRLLKFREKYSPPMLMEIVMPLAIWSIAFEFIGPYFFEKGTSDPFDVLAYCIGGIISWVIWNRSIFLYHWQNIVCLILNSIPYNRVRDGV